ncbi:hypothetical protein PVAND_015235 [Polypedilum vanderplanki]|uniref:RING-type domain-containing protein n=1 Tax=Polypedilum vanderplanki TaxID=319348 RepID=A0A9J6BC11_POLVA|nr:hypothetical protein PVAND_015235 [Polypedilum vanderplanki]
MEFKCLFCQNEIKDGDLVCTSSCEHFIHEWCIDLMKSSNEHRCRLCHNFIAVYSQFLEFDLSKAVTIKGVNSIVQKLDEIIKIISAREEKLTELAKNYQEIADKV